MAELKVVLDRFGIDPHCNLQRGQGCGTITSIYGLFGLFAKLRCTE
jgi:hypothetical protein